jgi:hypothetical protein
MELSEHLVNFEKRSAIKSQIMADFVTEWAELDSCNQGFIPELIWLVYCDRAGAVPELEHLQH